MKHYLSNEHIEILHKILPYIPKYDNFKLEDLSMTVKHVDSTFKDWTYLLSKFTSFHNEIFTDLWLNGFFKLVDKNQGICKLTTDGHKLKDIGDYNKYLEQLNAEYAAKRSESFLKTYWYIPSIVTFILGLFTSYLVNILIIDKKDNIQSHTQNIIKVKQITVDSSN
jgi:hypothetical protein